uniref:Oxytocin n=1 Tax=Callorhinchus milii TaxID=7868 RepID=A0A4W3IET2_CALMI
MHSACLALCLLCLVPFTMACYIQNCPLGGKRSIMDTQMRQCLPCGPDDRGRCFGPRICCGRDIGCYVGTAETLGCRGENYLPSPCEPAGRPCGSERGKCASPGICCDDGESICPHSPALARKDLKATEGYDPLGDAEPVKPGEDAGDGTHGTWCGRRRKLQGSGWSTPCVKREAVSLSGRV